MNEHLRSQWQVNAEAYSQLIRGKGTPHHRSILNPCVEKLMGTVKGRRILDAGCGEGYLARFYAQKGAKVVGVDFSQALIAKSKTLSADLPIHYVLSDLCDLRVFKAEEFDIVLCNLVLLNLECLDKSLSEFHRVLRPNGFLVFSVVHPAFNMYGPGYWKLGKKNGETGRREGLFFMTEDYFGEKEYQARWKTRTGEEFPKAFSFFHRTIGTYVNALLRIGFHLTAFEEPRPIMDDPFFTREQRIPFFLVIRAHKR
ncbi:MAG: class I SAM-dependent methyltransferase [Promethearchaeota archaeon]